MTILKNTFYEDKEMWDIKKKKSYNFNFISNST